MNSARLYDVTLRDGNHALRHTLSSNFVGRYCKEAEKSGVWAVEVGHGNGLGASSHLVGKSAESDFDLLTAARDALKETKLAVHSIPGFATIKRDLVPAISIGVDVFRVADDVVQWRSQLRRNRRQKIFLQTQVQRFTLGAAHSATPNLPPAKL